MITSATFLLLGVHENLIDPGAAAVVQPAAPGGDVGGAGAGGGVLPGSGAAASTAIEGGELIHDKYEKLFDIFSLPAVHLLAVYVVTMQVYVRVRL